MLDSFETNELEALIRVSKTVIANLDLDTVLELIMLVTTDVVQVDASSLILIDNETGELVFHIARGKKADIIKPIRMKMGEGIVGCVIQSGKAEIINDVTQDPRFYKKIDNASGFNTRSILCVPLATTNRMWGAIEVINKLDGSNFNDLDLTLCEAIAGQAAIAIENATLHKQIIKTERLAAIGQTIAGLAHCINNVLYGIQGGSYMVDLGLRKNDHLTMMKGWKIVKKNSLFMQDLVLDMLTYSKEREPEYEMVDVNEIIESVCNLMATKASEKGVDIIWAPNSFLDEIVLDSKGIRRCLLNLISNAVDACEKKKGGRVDVSTDVTSDNLCSIIISDNGCGICEEDRRKLFQIFFSTKGSKGTGLGLAVTHKIITEHDGTIDVESEVEQGTKFTIKLPLRKEIDMPTHILSKESPV
ncbi:ATP-binding protein [Candidatus Latescibacterota bacterium]